ncbi:hypothetical protein PFICI_08062 [Pestalotiopsis fici W106-1]|uniref:SnoaL-like domain-containing protein n=1 Tax=Pestalotiopsis fici (strain W106-1 / CGMCC3.15140) TaxID=1229662 RepID=W3X313_PESFW|nr:uncharacterized protein PFICI_08062 [Pestalotiopsis fici W106-1]ETS80533.1 hypothetical protein PFICI_08062 [Pestalotiopsis fici W106-1]
MSTMTTSTLLHDRLDSLYEVWQSLSPGSSSEDFKAFADFFSQDCTAWLLSMREHETPSIGRSGVIEGIQTAIQDSQIKARRVLKRFTDVTGSTISCEMQNSLTVHGKPLDPLYETAVVAFNDQGFITDFKLYSCRSAIVAIIQDVTGVGPYERHNECHKL